MPVIINTLEEMQRLPISVILARHSKIGGFASSFGRWMFGAPKAERNLDKTIPSTKPSVLLK